jgi:pimeloyl-ACP methyl ester carboxylesterase
MSAPFPGPPNAAAAAMFAQATLHLLDGLAALHPPRKHYQWYYSGPKADADMRHAPQGLHAFLRGYYHHKSADWPHNQPFALAAMSADELARLPTYYVMRADQTMAETVAAEMPSAAQIAACRWLPEEELAVYTAEYARTGFQGGLQWYRCGTGGGYIPEMLAWSGRTIDVPACFIAGRSDWGVFQKPGDFEAMQATACTRLRGTHWVEGAGHWVQQEQPAEVSRLLLDFLATLR